MLSIKKDIMLFIIASLLIYNTIPVLNFIIPESTTYTFLTDLWITNAIYSLIGSLYLSKKYGFQIWTIFVTACLFIPTMIIFYNTSAFIFLIIYIVIAVIGSIIGTLIKKKK